jgi:predicted metal-binding protein
MKVTICASCPLGSNGFPEALKAAMPRDQLLVEIATVDCMSGCARPSTLSVRSPGKTAYLFGDLDADDLPEILFFLFHYSASPDGTFSDARVLGKLRFKAIARIPA